MRPFLVYTYGVKPSFFVSRVSFQGDVIGRDTLADRRVSKIYTISNLDACKLFRQDCTMLAFV